VKPPAAGLLESAKDLVRKPWHLAAVVLIAALFLTNVYRAGTQSISHDEGVIYEWLLADSWSHVLTHQHGNHHVVSDLLSKLTISLFGLSEISLRIPALLGGLLYFYAVFRISALLFGGGILSLLSVALLCLNPFVLDYLVCARGYGLALGFFFYALYQLARHLADSDDGGRRLLTRAGVALGLSIGSNPIMVFPGAGLVLSLLALLVGAGLIRQPVTEAPVKGKPRNSRKEKRRQSRHQPSAGSPVWSTEQALLRFVLPAVAVGGVLSMLPSRLIELEVGYLGPHSLRAILEALVRFSIFHSPAGSAGLAAWLPEKTTVWIVTNLVVPAGLVGLLAVAIRIAAAWAGKRSFDGLPLISRFLLLLAGMMPVTVALIVLSRYGFQAPYPEMRTAMYWIPLLSLAFLSALRWCGEGGGIRRMCFAPVAAILVVCVLQYVTQFNTRYFAEWSYCAAGKDMMRIVRAEHERKPGTAVRVGATWQLEPMINFYRVAWGLDWMAPVYRQSPDGPFDYYLLAFGDTSLVERLHLKVLLRDRLSGTVLAKRADL
jgi:hypothetical protein